MDQEQIVADIEGRAARAGVSMRRLSKFAEIHPTTVSRWKKSAANDEPAIPSYASLQRLWNALDRIEAMTQVERMNL